MANKKKLTFAVSKGLAATGMMLVMSGCGPGAISNPAPPDDGCCVNPAPDFGPADDAGDAGMDAAADAASDAAGDAAADAEADAETSDGGADATTEDAGTD